MEGKKNTSARYLLCLALLLFAAFLVIATGTAFGRFRTDVDKDITFEIDTPPGIYIGTVVSEGEEESFDPDGVPEWTVEGDTATIEIAVSNGIPATSGTAAEYSEKDQKIKLRVIGSLGLTVGSEPAEITLMDGDVGYTAKAEEIPEYTLLYYDFGDGWIYSFEEDGEELFRILEGGKFSWIKMKLTVDISEVRFGAVIIEPQFISEAAD